MNQKIVLFGLGTMGAGMASNLLRAGFSLTVYSRTAAKAHPRIGAGARPAFSPAEADRGRPFWFLCSQTVRHRANSGEARMERSQQLLPEQS